MNPLSIAIVHAPWGKGRGESLQRLVESLWNGVKPGLHIFKSEGPRRTDEWANEIYAWALDRKSDLLVLEDDALLCPQFLDVLGAIREANPDRLCNLYNAHPSALDLAAKGVSAYTTLDWMTGVAQLIPWRVLLDFTWWRGHVLRKGAVETIKADTLLGLYAAVSGERVWHPIPTPVDHDDSLASLYGNSKSPMRRSLARWDRLPGLPLTSPAYWKSKNPFGADPLVHLGRIHPGTPFGYARWVLPDSPCWEATADRLERDVVTVIGKG
jgi:hypothetical protein